LTLNRSPLILSVGVLTVIMQSVRRRHGAIDPDNKFSDQCVRQL
jgi:hypothetical protein